MPIIGLTDRGASFPRIGELRKGGEKPAVGNKPGPDLKHFRFTSLAPEVEAQFKATYGNQPTAVNCYLPFASAWENFDAWIEEWVQGGLKWRGDGQNLVIWQTAEGKYSQEPKPQPKQGGKQVGRLKIIIPELGRLAYVTALTTSINDIMDMPSILEAYEALRGDLRGIPFVLSRVPRMVSTPDKDGKRVRREKWLWHLEAQPVWVQAQLSVMQRAALPTGGDVYQLSAGAIDTDTGEIVDDDEDATEVLRSWVDGHAIEDGKRHDELGDWENEMEDDREPNDLDTIRLDLAKYKRMTGVQVVDAAVSTGLYTSKDHAENALKQNESFKHSGSKLSAGIDGAVGLELFDWLMSRKAD